MDLEVVGSLRVELHESEPDDGTHIPASMREWFAAQRALQRQLHDELLAAADALGPDDAAVFAAWRSGAGIGEAELVRLLELLVDEVRRQRATARHAAQASRRAKLASLRPRRRVRRAGPRRRPAWLQRFPLDEGTD